MQYGTASWHGELRLSKDQGKCIDLLRESADLGCPTAQFHLGYLLTSGKMGLDQNEEEALKYWKKAAEGGDLLSRHNLGCGVEDENKKMGHFRLSASGGHRKSMDGLIVCFEDGCLRHVDLAETLQAMYHSRAEMKSHHRDQCIIHLKKIGEHRAEYDM